MFVLREFAGGDADHFQALGAKGRVSCSVFGARSSVLVAIEFNDQAGVGAIEVNNEMVDRLLAAELEAAEAAVPEARP